MSRTVRKLERPYSKANGRGAAVASSGSLPVSGSAKTGWVPGSITTTRSSRSSKSCRASLRTARSCPTVSVSRSSCEPICCSWKGAGWGGIPRLERSSTQGHSRSGALPVEVVEQFHLSGRGSWHLVANVAEHAVLYPGVEIRQLIVLDERLPGGSLRRHRRSLPHIKENAQENIPRSEIGCPYHRMRSPLRSQSDSAYVV